MKIESVGPPPPRRTFWSIQCLRGFAALAVVIFHATTGPLAPKGSSGFVVGQHGVDIFFVISGFIMYTAARNEPVVRFVITRALRIYPMYWIALATIILVYRTTEGWGFSGREMLASAILWPRYSLGHPDKIWPILVPGWTLSYEIFFYGLFAIGIAVRRVVGFPIIAIAILVLAGILFHPHSAPLVVATSPQLTEFAAGLLIAIVCSGGSLGARRLLPIFVTAFLVSFVFGFSWGKTIAFGSISIIVFLMMEEWIEGWSSAFKVLGDASYSIYLIHFPVITIFEYFLEERIAKLPYMMDWLATVVIAVISVAFGFGVHKFIERPFLRHSRRAILSRLA